MPVEIKGITGTGVSEASEKLAIFVFMHVVIGWFTLYQLINYTFIF